MNRPKSKIYIGTILAFCLLLVNVSGVFAAPIGAEHLEEDWSEESRSDGSAVLEHIDHLKDDREEKAEIYGIDYMHMAMEKGPDALREMGIYPSKLRRIFNAVGPRTGDNTLSGPRNNPIEAAFALASRLGIPVNEVAEAIQSGPMAMRELGMEHLASSGDSSPAEEQRHPFTSRNPGTPRRAKAMQATSDGGRRTAGSVESHERSDIEDDQFQVDRVPRVASGSLMLSWRVNVVASEVLERTAHRLGIEPAALEAAIQESVTELASNSFQTERKLRGLQGLVFTDHKNSCRNQFNYEGLGRNRHNSDRNAGQFPLAAVEHQAKSGGARERTALGLEDTDSFGKSSLPRLALRARDHWQEWSSQKEIDEGDCHLDSVSRHDSHEQQDRPDEDLGNRN